MPFGLKNGRSASQCTIDVVLPAVKWKFGPVYLDDVIIVSRLVKSIWTTYRPYWDYFVEGWRIMETEGKLFEDLIDYLEYVIEPGRLGKQTRATDVICKLPQTKFLEKLRSCFVFQNIFRRFIQIFARIAAP